MSMEFVKISLPNDKAFHPHLDTTRAHLNEKLNLLLPRETPPRAVDDKTVQDRRRKFLEHVRSASVFADLQQLGLDGELAPDKNKDPLSGQEFQQLQEQTLREDIKSPYLVALRSQLSEIPDPSLGTCRWIQHDINYKKWLRARHAPDNVLILLADPGNGKTVLAKSVCLRLANDKVPVIPFFCRRKVTSRQDASCILASFIYLLFREFPRLEHHISEYRLRQAEQDQDSALTFLQLSQLFNDLCGDDIICNHVFIIDAFDECDEKSQWQLSNALFQSKQGVQRPRIFVTSRSVPVAPLNLGKALNCITSKKDILSKDAIRYLDQELREDGIESTESFDAIRNKIKERSEGMFLIISFRLRQLKEARQDPNFNQDLLKSSSYLNDFFSHGTGLDFEFYSGMLEHVPKLGRRQQEEAAISLSILLAAQASFTNDELSAAYELSQRSFKDYEAFSSSQDFLRNISKLDMIDRSEKLCGPIVRSQERDSENKTISIFHLTASEFLEEFRNTANLYPASSLDLFMSQVNRKAGHVLLARACLQLLILIEAPKLLIGSDIGQYPLLSYSLSNWQIHVKESQELITDYDSLLERFFSAFSSGYRLWDATDRWLRDGFGCITIPAHQTPIVTRLVRLRLINVLRAVKRTKDLAKWDLYNCSLNINELNEEGSNAVHDAVIGSASEYLEILLELGAVVDCPTSEGRTPLHLAISLASTQSINLLVSFGASFLVETNHPEQYTPLLISVSVSREIFRLVLKLGGGQGFVNSDGRSVAHEAAADGNIELLESLFDEGLIENVDAQDSDGCTPMMYALMNSSREVVQYLIATKANVDLGVKGGTTALRGAVDAGNLGITSDLLPFTTSKDVAVDGWSAIHLAAFRGQHDLVEILVKAKVDIDAVKGYNFWTALMLAIQAERYKTAFTLIYSGANIKIRGRWGVDALMIACTKDNVTLVEALLKAGADPYTTLQVEGTSCLHIAASKGHLDIIKVLVAAREPSAKIDELDSSKEFTPLFRALRGGHIEVAKFLLAYYDTLTTLSTKGWSALHLAARYTEDASLFQMLLGKSPRKHYRAATDAGSTVLHLAASTGFVQAIQMLVQLDSDCSVRDIDLLTPLFWAAFAGTDEAVEVLLQHKCFPNALAINGLTALHASCHGRSGTTVAKLNKRTHYYTRKRAAVSPLQIAILNNNTQAVSALLEDEFSINISCKTGFTDLHPAAFIGNAPLCKRLLNAGADVNALDGDNALPISEAYIHRDLDLLSLLRPTNANVHLWSSKSLLSSPMHNAASISWTEMIWHHERGAKLLSLDAGNHSTLGVAIECHRHDIVENLVQGELASGYVNLPTLICGRTPAHMAAMRWDHITLGLLLRYTSVNLQQEDLFGNTVIDYVFKHQASCRVLSFFCREELEQWRHRKRSDKEDKKHRRQLAIHQICKLISWMLDREAALLEEQVFDKVDEDLAMLTLSQGMSIVGDKEHYVVTNEVRLQLSWRKWGFNAQFCDSCVGALKRPYYHENEVLDPFWDCLVCGWRLCPDCKIRSRQEREEAVLSCHMHEFVSLPTKSWFTRDPQIVNEKNQTKREWLQGLVHLYGGQKDENFDVSVLPDLVDSYDEGRKSVFDLCQRLTMPELLGHLEQYPRDIALKDSDGATVVHKVFDLGFSDLELTAKLISLASLGATMLTYNNERTSTIKLACQAGFESTSTFLLEQFDPYFETTTDPFSSESLQIIIKNQWTRALAFAIKRHFDWATSSEEFDYLREASALGLTDDEIIELLLKPAPKTQSPMWTFLDPNFLEDDVGKLPKRATKHEGCIHSALDPLHIVFNDASNAPLAPETSIQQAEQLKSETEKDDSLEPQQDTSKVSKGPEQAERDPELRQEAVDLENNSQALYSSQATDDLRSDESGSEVEGGDQDLEDDSSGSEDLDSDIEDLQDTDIDEDPRLMNTCTILDKAAYLCGLGGVFPDNQQCAEFKAAVDDSYQVSLRYPDILGRTVDTHTVPDTRSLLRAGSGLLEAIALAQEMELCCDSFTLLHRCNISKTDGSLEALQLSQIPVALVLEFTEQLKTACAAEKETSLDGNDERYRAACFIASRILAHCTIERKMSHRGPSEALDECGLAMQLLCLGFVSFLNGHLSKAEHPVITVKVSSFLLLGYTGAFQVELRPWKMACVGTMLQDQLMAFHVVDSKDSDLQLSPSPDFAYNLLTSIEDMLELWGPARCIGKLDWDGISQEAFVAIYVRQGYITIQPSSDSHLKEAHWSTEEIVPKSLQPFSAKELLNIGKLRLKENGKCKLKTQQAWDYANISRLQDLATYEDFWTLASRQINLQLSGPHVAVAISQNYDRVRGLYVKEDTVVNWEHLPKMLNRPWGIIYSICTGFTERVPLRVCIAEVLQKYLVEDVPSRYQQYSLPDDWEDFKQELVDHLHGGDLNSVPGSEKFLRYWNMERPVERKAFAISAITFVLQRLKQTGLQDNGIGQPRTFNMAWADGRDPFRALHLDCTKSRHEWLHLFADTKHKATFAVATPRCLVARTGAGIFGSTFSCRCPNPTSFIPPVQINLLQTKVLPGGEFDRNWILRGNANYCFKPQAPKVIVCIPEVIESSGGNPNVKKYLIVINWGDSGWRTLDYIARRYVERSQEVLQENHLAYHHRLLEPVRICTFKNWLKQQT